MDSQSPQLTKNITTPDIDPSVFSKGLEVLLGKSKQTTIAGGIFVTLLAIVLYPQSLGWIGISEVHQIAILGYLKFTMFVSGIFFAFVAKQNSATGGTLPTTPEAKLRIQKNNENNK